MELLFEHHTWTRSASGLVELNLSLYTEWGSPPEASLLSNLRRMSCLRRLELSLLYHPFTPFSDLPLPTVTGDVVPLRLSELTHVIFTGHRTYLEALLIGSAAPSLQHFVVTLYGQPHSAFTVPHLYKFICNSECQFTKICLVFSRSKLKFYAGTGSESFDDLPFRIVTPEPVSLEKMGQELSAPLSDVEELIITLGGLSFGGRPNIVDQLRRFFYHVPQVRVMQVPARETQNIARSLQQDGQEPAVDLLPALEQIKVDMKRLPQKKGWRRSSRDAFEPLVAARKRVGRPIILSYI